ncbi:MAG: hypothetical protein Q4C70_13410 [Planctomycetia bacterium]|nr:hypothetical protein [Planctomycetia bacterium]
MKNLPLSILIATFFIFLPFICRAAGEYSPVSEEIPLLGLKMTAVSVENPLETENGAWRLSSGEKNVLEFLPDGEGSCNGNDGARHEPCLKVTSEGNSWVYLRATERIKAVEKGKVMLFKAWIRFSDGVGRLNAVLYRDGKPIEGGKWSSGNGMSYESDNWNQYILKIPSTGTFDEVELFFQATSVTEKMLEHVRDPKGEPLPEERAKLVTNRIHFTACAPELEVGESLEKYDMPKIEGYFKCRVEEKLTREFIVLPADGNGNQNVDENGKATQNWYLTWRLLKTDSPECEFNIYRREKSENNDKPWVKITAEPIRKTTDFLDNSGDKNVSTPENPVSQCPYEWKLVDAAGNETLARVSDFEHGLSIQLRNPESKVSRMAISDLDGDGRYDYVFLLNPGGNVDPYYYYWIPSTQTQQLEAYTADGEFLWARDLGPGIENGIWYSPFISADLDGDGCAEVIVKTAGTESEPITEKSGTFPASDFSIQNVAGRVDSGPEWVSVWDGKTGKDLARAPWLTRSGLTYNYYCRSMLTVAYLDGKTPILLALRGTYSLQKMRGWQFRDGKLEEKFFWTNALEDYYLWGRGAHTLHSVDVDADGRDEIAVGTFILDDNGAALWSRGLQHPDHLYIGDIIPIRPGLEVYWGIEGAVDAGGMGVLDAKTGEFIWKFEEKTYHIHAQGLCADIDPEHPGCECFGGESKNPHSVDRYLWSAEGKLLQRRPSPEKLREENPDLDPEKDLSNRDIGQWSLGMSTAYWDADAQKEIVLTRKGHVYSYGKDEIYEPYFRFRAGTLFKVCDVVGDWREELFVSAPGEVRIYMTKIPAENRRPTLMQDRNYRASILESSMGYNQSPLLGE